MYKTHQLRTTFRSCDEEKCAFRSQKCKNLRGTEHFWTFRCRGRRKGLCTFSRVSKTWGFCSISKNDGRRGPLKRICKDAFRVAGAIQKDMLQGADFLRRVAFWSIRSSGLRRWFCATGAALCIWLGITFSWQTQYFRQMKWKKRKTHWCEAVSSALNFQFLKEVSQNCFVFDVVNFENWRKCRRIATLHYTTLHYTTLHYTTLITLHYTTLHFTSLHSITLHYTTLQLQLQLHYITLHYTNYITLH